MASKLKKLQMPTSEQDMLPEDEFLPSESEPGDEDMPESDEMPASPLADIPDEELIAEVRARGLESKLGESEEDMKAEVEDMEYEDEGEAEDELA